jgi:hypothetical protein
MSLNNLARPGQKTRLSFIQKTLKSLMVAPHWGDYFFYKFYVRKAQLLIIVNFCYHVKAATH